MELVPLLDGLVHLGLEAHIDLILLVVHLDLLSHSRPQQLESLLGLVRYVGTQSLGGQAGVLNQIDFMVLVFVKRFLGGQ